MDCYCREGQALPTQGGGGDRAVGGRPLPGLGEVYALVRRTRRNERSGVIRLPPGGQLLLPGTVPH